jgi:hypothetical protein
MGRRGGASPIARPASPAVRGGPKGGFARQSGALTNEAKAG